MSTDNQKYFALEASREKRGFIWYVGSTSAEQGHNFLEMEIELKGA